MNPMGFIRPRKEGLWSDPWNASGLSLALALCWLPPFQQDKEFLYQSFEFPCPFPDYNSDFWEPEVTAQISHTGIQDMYRLLPKIYSPERGPCHRCIHPSVQGAATCRRVERTWACSFLSMYVCTRTLPGWHRARVERKDRWTGMRNQWLRPTYSCMSWQKALL